MDAASILMDEYVGPSLVDLKLSESDFAMMSSSQVGILGNSVRAPESSAMTSRVKEMVPSFL